MIPDLGKLIKQTDARSDVEVHLPDGRVFSGPRGTQVGKILKAVPDLSNAPIMGAIVNGEIRELTFSINMDARVQPLTMGDADGARIYRRSLTFLLEAAFEDLYPDALLAVDHSVASGGFFCQVVGRPQLSREDLDRLENHMREIVEADLPFQRFQVPLEEAIEYFKQKGQSVKVKLLRYRKKKHLMMYQLGTHRDYHHGYMVASSGDIKWFDLNLMDDGFVIRYPRRHRPTELLPLPDSTRLLATFKQYGGWLERLGIGSVGALNDEIKTNRISEIILVSEALQAQQIAEIAAEIVDRHDEKKIILIAGPSSSGKTTFSKRLAIQLLAHGISPFPLEMDNYFVDREKTPLDENGQYDYESIGALDTLSLGKHLSGLISGEEVQLPRFNFKTGKSELGDVVKLEKDQLIILEGIHGLNPRLIPSISREHTFRIFASCLTQLNLDSQNRISTTDTRLIRRIVRDSRERGYSAQQTIQQWESVRRGEKRNIFPYQEHADEMFNSALVYELAAMKPFAEPLLRQVPFGTSEFIEAKRLLTLLEWFLPVDTLYVPNNSILKEFVGGSLLKDFKIWKKVSE